MIIADLNQIEGRAYPAGRRTRNLVGGVSPIQIKDFCMGYVVLEPNGGQVPWHNQEQEEVYFIVSGTGEMCLGEEKTNRFVGAVRVYPDRRFSPTHQHGNRTDGDDVRLRPRRRCRALAAGVVGHAPQSGL